MNLTQRDHELLRTLVRVQLATTSSLGRTFFPDFRSARRRLLTLRSVGDLITPHSKGLPGKMPPSGGQYWRITETGLQVFAERFPRERIPNNHITRVRNASLRCFEHRSAMTDLYLRLIACKDRDIDELHSRANAVDWRCEWEVVLPYKSIEGVRYVPKTIIPDATLTTPHARYFLEVDQSTESRSTCRRTLQNYASALKQESFASLFPDKLPVVVVYVTKSDDRALDSRSSSSPWGHCHTVRLRCQCKARPIGYSRPSRNHRVHCPGRQASPGPLTTMTSSKH